jgi:hypothetical protein
MMPSSIFARKDENWLGFASRSADLDAEGDRKTSTETASRKEFDSFSFRPPMSLVDQLS